MISAVEKYDFIERYIGLMSDSDMALELRTTTDDVRKLKKEFSQLCWDCKNACDGNKCVWVKTNNYPRYVELDGEGRIVECDKYEYEFSREHRVI